MEKGLTDKFISSLNIKAFQQLLQKKPKGTSDLPPKANVLNLEYLLKSSDKSKRKSNTSPASPKGIISSSINNRRGNEKLLGSLAKNIFKPSENKTRNIDSPAGINESELNQFSYEDTRKKIRNDKGSSGSEITRFKIEIPGPEEEILPIDIADTRIQELGEEIVFDKPQSPFSNSFQSFTNFTFKFTGTETATKQQETEKKSERNFESLYYKEIANKVALEKKLAFLELEYKRINETKDEEIANMQIELKSLKNKLDDFHYKDLIKSKSKAKFSSFWSMYGRSLSGDINRELSNMEKEQLIQEYDDLKRQNRAILKKVMSQADELYEKAIEIKQLNTQRTEIVKELSSLKDLNFELSELKEHNAYLLNMAQNMRMELKALAHKYIKYADPKERSSVPELINRLSKIADTAQDKISIITDKSHPAYMDWLRDRKMNGLIQNIKTSIFKFIHH